jgi:hypothetical protein
MDPKAGFVEWNHKTVMLKLLHSYGTDSDFVRHTIPVLGISLVVLLVFASGCIGNIQSKDDVRNMSNGSPGMQTTVTIGPTGTGSTETLVTGAPGVTTTSNDVCIFGSKNCHLYEQCTSDCLKSGTSPEDCAKVCCHTKCFDLPTNDEKVACSKVCLAKLSEPTQTLVPLDTPETLVPLSTPDTLVPLSTPDTLVPL